MTRCDDCPPNLRAGWGRNTVLATVGPVATDTLPRGWTRKGILVRVCCQCVQDGDVIAPPSGLRTDGYCPRHAAQVRAQIAGRKAGR